MFSVRTVGRYPLVVYRWYKYDFLDSSVRDVYLICVPVLKFALVLSYVSQLVTLYLEFSLNYVNITSMNLIIFNSLINA